MRRLAACALIVLPVLAAGCDRIGDPWVAGDQLAEERSRSERLQDRLIDRAERGQTDR